MSAQLELVELSCDSDTVRFSLSEGHTVTAAVQAIARSPHLHNIVSATESDEGVQSLCVPQGCIQVWLQHVAQSDDQSTAALKQSNSEDLIQLLKVFSPLL